MNYLICVLFLIIPSVSSTFIQDPDKGRSFASLIASRGFTLKTYKVKTSDGYILTLHRVVPKGKFSPAKYSRTRKPVIVQHGLMGSSTNFLIGKPTVKPYLPAKKCASDFGFCLVQTGRYDIWLPNSRGNGYSMEHVRLKPNQKEFWNFTFDQMARYDSPAVIKFIQNTTKRTQIGYIGHSQGATQIFALLSLQPKYASILRPFISWAPAVYIGHMSSIVKWATYLAPLLQKMDGQFILSGSGSNKVSTLFCGIPFGLGTSMCSIGLEAVVGVTDSLNQSRLPVVSGFTPSSTSTHNMVHFAQLYQTNSFLRYNYGNASLNKKVYGQSKPPLYPLERIPANSSIVIMHGATDALVGDEDVGRLVKQLRKQKVKVIDYRVPRSKWNHIDFAMGIEAGKLVYDKTIALLDQLMG